MFGTHTRQVTEFFRAYSYHYIKSERGSDLGDGGQSHFKRNHGGWKEAVVASACSLPASSVTLRAPGHVVAGLVERDDPDRVHGARLCGNFCQRLCRPVAGARRMPGLALQCFSHPVWCVRLQFWIPGSTEVLCAAVGRRGLSPVAVGLAGAAGQSVLFVLLFLFGSRASSRWPALRRRVDSIAMQRRKLVDRGSLAMTMSAAAIGVPPTVPLFTLAPSLHMRLPPMLCLVFLFRFVRFSVICGLASLHSAMSTTPGPEKWPAFTPALAFHRAHEVRPPAATPLRLSEPLLNATLRRAGARAPRGSSGSPRGSNASWVRDDLAPSR